MIDPRKCVSSYVVSSIGSDQSYDVPKALEVIFPCPEIVVTKNGTMHNDESCHEDYYQYQCREHLKKHIFSFKRSTRRKSIANINTRKGRKLIDIESENEFGEE